MCRICGRMVKCIFDTMPSRTISRPNLSQIVTQYRVPTQCQKARQISSQARLSSILRPSPAQSRHIQLPVRIRALHSTSLRLAELETSAATQATEAFIPPTLLQSSVLSQQAPDIPTTPTTTTLQPTPTASSPKEPLILSKSIQQLLPALAAQSPHYITAHIHSFPYLLTAGDTLRLPFHLHGVSPGDTLRFNRATILGSRDYTLKAAALPSQVAAGTHLPSTAQNQDDVNHTPNAFKNGKRTGEPSYIDERLYECRVRVMGLDSGPMMVTEKKKRRNRHLKKVMSKHKYTVVKVMEVKIKTLEEVLEEEKGQVVLE